METPLVVTKSSVSAYGNRRLIAGLLVGAALGWMFAQAPEKVEVPNNAHKLCQWPRHEAEALIALVVNGKVQCYELTQ